MITDNFHSCLLSKANSTNTKLYIFVQGCPNDITTKCIESLALKILHKKTKTATLEDLERKVLGYLSKNPLILKEIEERHNEYLASLPIKKRNKVRKKYKKRRWRGHSYGWRLIVNVGYLLQCYYFAFGLEGKQINPSKAVLAKEVGICIRTLDKALKILREIGFLTWISGKKTWETNIYIIAEAYRITPMRRSHDFKIPKKLWLKMQYMLKKQRFKIFWNLIYEHMLKDIADHLLRKNKYLRTFLKKELEKSLKRAKDPPKKRKKPPNWHLLKSFNLSFKDQWVIGRYPEVLLRSAIDDLNYYKEQGKKIVNTPAFLTERCKAHKGKLDLLKKENRTNIKDWLMNYFKAHSKRFNFISDKSAIDRQADDLRPFIELRFHKENTSKSILHVYQKVCGTWVDKLFTFDRPDFIDSVENYLENSLKYQEN